MSLEDDARTLIAGLSAVQALLSNNPKSGDKPVRVDALDEHDPYPGIVVEVPEDTWQNELANSGSLVIAELHVLCYARTKASAMTLGEAVRTNGGAGTGLQDRDAAPFEWVTMQRRSVRWVRESEGSDAGVWERRLIFQVGYIEP